MVCPQNETAVLKGLSRVDTAMPYVFILDTDTTGSTYTFYEREETKETKKQQNKSKEKEEKKRKKKCRAETDCESGPNS